MQFTNKNTENVGSNQLDSRNNNQNKLRFHEVRSTNIHISSDSSIVKRFNPGWGFCFSSRPLKVNECLALKVLLFHKGTLKFGLTTRNPDSLRNGGFCFDDTLLDNLEENGCWIKEMSKKSMKQHNIVFFLLTDQGELLYGINNKCKGVLFSEIPIMISVWAYFNLIGKMLAIQIIDMNFPINKKIDYVKKISRSKSLELVSQTSSTDDKISNSNLSADQSREQKNKNKACNRDDRRLSIVNISTAEVINRSNTVFENNNNESRLSSTSRNAPRSRSARFPNSTVSSNINKEINSAQICNKEIMCPMSFHCSVGKNICLSSDQITAVRHMDSRCNCYVFTKHPLKINEKLMISIGNIVENIPKMLTFGLTVCNPEDVEEMPDDADLLLDRPEYWVIRKNFSKDLVEGVELGIIINKKGEVQLFKDNAFESIIMHVDISLPLWPFFDISDAVQKITCLGLILTKRSRRKDSEDHLNIAAPSSSSQQYLQPFPHSTPLPVIGELSNSSADPTYNLSVASHQNSLHGDRQLAPNQNKSRIKPKIEKGECSYQSVRSRESDQSLRRNHDFHDDQNLNYVSNNMRVDNRLNDANNRTRGHNEFNNTSQILDTSLIGATNVFTSMPLDTPDPQMQSNQLIDLFTDLSIISAPPLIPLPTESQIPIISSKVTESMKHDLEEATTSIKIDNKEALSRSKSEDFGSMSECIICFEGTPDCALYTCGHMCLCFACAQRVMKKQNPLCPVCRKPIMDILRIFKS